MKRSNLVRIGTVLSACAVLAAGCEVGYRGPGGTAVVAAEPGVVYADTAPPAPVYEPVPIAPGPDFIWIGGSWVWGGGRWQWERGRWAQPPHPGAHWVAHHNEYRNGRHAFVRGGWR